MELNRNSMQKKNKNYKRPENYLKDKKPIKLDKNLWRKNRQRHKKKLLQYRLKRMRGSDF